MKSEMHYRASKAAFLGICLLLFMAFGFVRAVVTGSITGQNNNSKPKSKDKAKIVPSETPKPGNPGRPSASPSPKH